MGCCVNRAKLDNFGNIDTEIFTLNSIPTFENIQQVYEQMDMPDIKEECLAHKKEQMVFMIVNLLRVRPKIFLYQMETLKCKYDRLNKPRTMMFYSNDVEDCITLLQ